MRGMLVALCWVMSAGQMIGVAASAASDEVSRSRPAQTECEQARDALAQAETAVKAAAARRALWTTAEEALRKARSAFAAGDCDAATRAARAALEQARLGVEQTRYPMLQFPRL